MKTNRIKFRERHAVATATAAADDTDLPGGATSSFHWPVYKYAILDRPTGYLVSTFARQRRRDIGPGTSTAHTVWPRGGLFAYQEFVAPPSVPWQPQIRRAYRPLEHRNAILDAAVHLDPRDTSALLAFVNTWGRLGVGVPGAEDFDLDGVEHTRTTLQRFQTYHNFVQTKPKHASSLRVLAVALNPELAGLHPALHAVGARWQSVFELHTLKDVLFLEVWRSATGADRMRRCLECRAVFYLSRAGQRFCSSVCRDRYSVRRSRAARRLHPPSGRRPVPRARRCDVK